jgi:N-acetylglutamate synthase-like GNAT family acetyltransferase
VEIRKASAADLEAVTAVVERAYSGYVPRIGRRPKPMDDDYAELIEAGKVWVLADPEVVGITVLEPAADHLLVENVAVHPARQGEGLGPQLLAFAEGEARARELSELRLYTHELMTENIELYGRLGWEAYDRRQGDGFARVFFRKRLDVP